MNTHMLRTLLKLSEVGSFGRAAEELNMTVSAVSMQMKSLEKSLGAQILDRRYRPPRLTPVGRGIVKHAEVIVSEEQLLFGACMSDDVLAGRFRLGLIMTASVRLLPKLLGHAMRTMPATTLQVTTGLTRELTDLVADGRLDAALVTATPERLGLLNHDTILQERLMFAVPGDSWAAARSLAALDIPFIRFSPQSGVGEVITDYLGGSFIASARSIVLDSVEAIMECVNCSIGYALLPEPDILRYARDSVAVIGADGGPVRDISLITRRDSISTKHRNALLTLLDTSGVCT